MQRAATRHSSEVNAHNTLQHTFATRQKKKLPEERVPHPRESWPCTPAVGCRWASPTHETLSHSLLHVNITVPVFQAGRSILPCIDGFVGVSTCFGLDTNTTGNCWHHCSIQPRAAGGSALRFSPRYQVKSLLLRCSIFAMLCTTCASTCTCTCTCACTPSARTDTCVKTSSGSTAAGVSVRALGVAHEAMVKPRLASPINAC